MSSFFRNTSSLHFLKIRFYFLIEIDFRAGKDDNRQAIELQNGMYLNNKKESCVLQVSINENNQVFRHSEKSQSSERNHMMKRLGCYVDVNIKHNTTDIDYMESIWWGFSKMWEKQYIYQDFKVLPYCITCKQPLSDFEASLNYKQLQDTAIIVRFSLLEDPDVNMVAWTTMPWTLTSNLALCVHPDWMYVQVQSKADGRQYILNDKCMSSMFKKASDYNVMKTCVGSELVGKKYTPLFPYFVDRFPNAFKVVSDRDMTCLKGTGIVHQAPAFDEDDHRICVRESICTVTDCPCPITEDGHFTSEVSHFAGQSINTANTTIIAYLKNSSHLVHRTSITHSWPLCWRSNTPLIHRVVSSWFINIASIRDRMLTNHAQTHWISSSIKDKHFNEWLKYTRDWPISRINNVGIPLPIWFSDDGEERVVIDNIEALAQRVGIHLTDVDQHFLKDITIPSDRGKGTLKRIPDVFDSAFEHAFMFYAQHHYPFENNDMFELKFPTNLMITDIDQTRGWIYPLLIISTMLFDMSPFKNLLVHGRVRVADRKKMSHFAENLGNPADPSYIINKYSGDALRLYLIHSPIVCGETLKFEESGVLDIVKHVFSRWYGTYRLLVKCIMLIQVETRQKFIYDRDVNLKTHNITDKALLSSMQSLIKFMCTEMAAYRLYTVIPRLIEYIQSLGNGYVRWNRHRLKGKQGWVEQQYALSTLTYILLTLCRLMAPFTPFFVESLYQNLKYLMPEHERLASVHYLSFPDVDEMLINESVEIHVSRMQEVIELGRSARNIALCPIQQPLTDFIVFHKDLDYLKSLTLLQSYITSQLSVRNLVLRSDVDHAIVRHMTLNYKILGPRLRGDMDKVKEICSSFTPMQIDSFLHSGSMIILGHTITLDDVDIVSQFKINDPKTQYQSAGNKHVVTVLNLTKVVA